MTTPTDGAATAALPFPPTSDPVGATAPAADPRSTPGFGLSVFANQNAQEPTPAPPLPNAAATAAGAVNGPVSPETTFMTASDQQAQDQKVTSGSTSAPSALSLWWHSDSSVAAFERLAKSMGFTPDPSYRLPQYGSPAWDQLTQGIPSQYWDGLGFAVSEPHAEYIASEIRKELQVNAEWAGKSHPVLEQLGFGLLDPANLALAAFGGPELSAASRVGRFLIGGARAGVENAALSAALDAGKETPDGHDIANAALTGFLTGGLLHGALPAHEAAEVTRAGWQARRAIGINETADAVRSGAVPIEAVRPDVRAEIAAREAADSVTAASSAADAKVAAIDHAVNEHLANEESRLQAIADATPADTSGSPPVPVGDASGVLDAAPEAPTAEQIGAAKSALASLRAAVKASEGSTEGRIGAIPDQTVRDSFATQLEAARREQFVAGEGNFGPDSASAARASTDVAPAIELNPETAPVMVPQSSRVAQAMTAGRLNPLKTFASVLRGSGNPIVRSRLGRMFGEVVAAHDDSAGTVGASDHVQMLAHAWETHAGQIEYAHKPAWMQERGYSGVFQRYSRKVQHEWSDAVGRAIRGETTDSEPVKQAAAKYAELYNEIRQEARRAGVKGFETLEANEHYLPRAFDFERIKELNRELGDKGMVQFLADGMQNAMDGSGLDRPAIEAIAKGYLQRVKRLALGVDGTMLNGIRLSDVEYLRDMLKDAPDVDPEQVDDVVDQLKRRMQQRGGDQGSIRHAKHRVSFDETHAIDVPGLGRVSIADLFSNDAHALTSRYVRTMSGAIGLARVGIKSDSDFARSLKEAISSLGEYGVGREERETVRAYAEGGYRLLLSRPLDHEGFGMWQQIARTARDYAFTRSMGRGGFSIANNLIRPWTNGYARYATKYLPALTDIFSSRDANGELSDPLMRDIERYTGIGADSVSMSVFNHYDDDGLLGKIVNAAGHGLKVASRWTSHVGGLTPGLVFGKRLMAVAILDRLVRHSFGEATVPAGRLAMMGLDDAMMARIAAQLREHAPGIEGNGGQRIRSVNWANWSDLEARDAMLTAINREANTLIHGEDVASTGLWMNKWWGRLAIQLRRFPMMAMSKQLARGLHQRDLDSVMDLLLTGTVGALSMYSQAHLMTIGMRQQDRLKYLQENASPGRLLAAFIQRNPYSGMLPQLIDTAALWSTGHPVFDTRSTGLSGGLLSGMPAYSAGSGALSAASGITRLITQGRSMTRGQWRSLIETLPLGNSLPLVWATNAMADSFPRVEPKVVTEGQHKGPWLQ